MANFQVSTLADGVKVEDLGVMTLDELVEHVNSVGIAPTKFGVNGNEFLEKINNGESASLVEKAPEDAHALLLALGMPLELTTVATVTA